MATGDRQINMYQKKVAPEDQIREGWLEYTLGIMSDNLEALYPSSGFFTAPTVTGPANDTFAIGANGALLSEDNFTRRFDYAGGDNIVFENTTAVDYWVEQQYALAPIFSATGLEGSPDFGDFRYSLMEEKVGYLEPPDSASDLGAAVRLVVDDVLRGGVGATFDQSGRSITVMAWPNPQSLDPAVAFQSLTVQWSGSQNYVDAADYIGFTAIQAASAYRVFVPVCTIAKSDPTGVGDGIWAVKITGNGPGFAPVTFDYSGQVLLGFSPAALTAAFQVDHELTGGGDDGLHTTVRAFQYQNRTAAQGASDGIKIDLQAVSGTDLGVLVRIRDFSGALLYSIDGAGNVIIEGDIDVTGTAEIDTDVIVTDDLDIVSGKVSSSANPLRFIDTLTTPTWISLASAGHVDFTNFSSSPTALLEALDDIVDGLTLDAMYDNSLKAGSSGGDGRAITVDSGPIPLTSTEANLVEPEPFQWYQEVGEGTASATKGVNWMVAGADMVYPSPFTFVVPYHDGANFPSQMTCTTKASTDDVDISGIPDLTLNAILNADNFVVLIENTTTRDGWYMATVLDLDTVEVQNLDGTTHTWTAGDEGGVISFFLPTVRIGWQNTGFDFGFAQNSFDATRIDVGFVAQDIPFPFGNGFWGFGFLYHDLNRGKDLFSADADGVVKAGAFAGIDEILDALTERYTGLNARGYAAENDDTLIFTGEETAAGRVYIGRPNEGGTAPWRNYTEPFVVLDSTSGAILWGDWVPDTGGASNSFGDATYRWRIFAENINASTYSSVIPTVTGTDLGSTGARWDAFLRDLDISGSITGALLAAAASQDIGAGGSRWGTVFADALNVTNVVAALVPDVNSDGATGYDIGGVANRWRDLFVWDGRFWGTLEADGDCDFGGTATSGLLRGDWSFGFLPTTDDINMIAQNWLPGADGTIELGRHWTNSGAQPVRKLHHIVSDEFWVAESMRQTSNYDKTTFTTAAITGGKTIYYQLSPGDGQGQSDWVYQGTYWSAPENSTHELFFPIELKHGEVVVEFEGRMNQTASTTYDVRFGYWDGSTAAQWSFTTLKLFTSVTTGSHAMTSTTIHKMVDLSAGRRYGILVIANTGAAEQVQVEYLRLKVLTDQVEIER